MVPAANWLRGLQVVFLCAMNPRLFTTAQDFDQQNKPHIVMIVADDLGFNDVPWHNKEVIAPNLQKLAEGGIILEQSYVQPVCSPTRAAILSGVYPFATGRQGDVIWPLQPTGLTLSLSLIPQYLKRLGYKTHAIGKWHLGFCKWDYTPTERGFETFRGYYTGSEDYYTHKRTYYGSKNKGWLRSNRENFDYFPDISNVNESYNPTAIPGGNPTGYDFRDNKSVYYQAFGYYSTYEFASHVETFLHSENSSVPKFLYMAFQSVHTPLEVPDNYTKPYAHIRDKNRRTYLAMVSAMDEAIGRIITALKETNHYNNSVIVFTTDNGGPTITGANNWPLRGNKTTLWEGGTRGAAFIHSPLLPNPGRMENNLIHATDWLATFITIAGGIAPNGTDSISQWEALLGTAPPPRKELVYNILSTKSAFMAGIRVGDFKLLVGNPGPGDWTPPPEIEKESSHVSSLSDFLELKFAMETELWKFEDHMNFIKKMKIKCKNLPCFRSVLKTYRKTKTSENRKIWFKAIMIIKEYTDLFQTRINNVPNAIDKDASYNSHKTAKFASTNPKRKREKRNITNQTLVDFDSIEKIFQQDLPLRLYHLKVDPEERRNLAFIHPGITVALLRRLLSYRGRYVPADEPNDDHRGSPEFWGGAWSPGWC